MLSRYYSFYRAALLNGRFYEGTSIIMKIKRMIALIIIAAVAFSMTGCNSKREIVFQAEPRTEYSGYLNTEWGMTVDEALQALGWDEETVVRGKVKDPDKFQAKLSIGRISVQFGEVYMPVTLTFTYIDKTEPVLTGVRFRDVQEENAKGALDYLNKHYNTSISIEDKQGDFAQSFATSDYYTPSTWERLEEYYRSHLEKSEEDDLIYEIAKTPLASARFEILYPKDTHEFLYNDEEGILYTFTFDGTQAAVLKHLNK